VILISHWPNPQEAAYGDKRLRTCPPSIDLISGPAETQSCHQPATVTGIYAASSGMHGAQILWTAAEPA